MPPDEQAGLREALKRVAVALKQSELPFALAGGYAAWARGAPENFHDVDFVVRHDDAATAQQALREAGLTIEQPPEDWLFKVVTDGVVVDILYRLSQKPADDSLFGRAEELEVLSVRMPVICADDIMTSKLAAMNEHACDLAAILPVARALREQIHWDDVASAVEDNDFANAALYLFERLGIVPD